MYYFNLGSINALHNLPLRHAGVEALVANNNIEFKRCQIMDVFDANKNKSASLIIIPNLKYMSRHLSRIEINNLIIQGNTYKLLILTIK